MESGQLMMTNDHVQVFSVRSGGATGVTIKSPHGEPQISLVRNQPKTRPMDD